MRTQEFRKVPYSAEIHLAHIVRECARPYANRLRTTHRPSSVTKRIPAPKPNQPLPKSSNLDITAAVRTRRPHHIHVLFWILRSHCAPPKLIGSSSLSTRSYSSAISWSQPKHSLIGMRIALENPFTSFPLQCICTSPIIRSEIPHCLSHRVIPRPLRRNLFVCYQDHARSIARGRDQLQIPLPRPTQFIVRNVRLEHIVLVLLQEFICINLIICCVRCLDAGMVAEGNVVIGQTLTQILFTVRDHRPAVTVNVPIAQCDFLISKN